MNEIKHNECNIIGLAWGTRACNLF